MQTSWPCCVNSLFCNGIVTQVRKTKIKKKNSKSTEIFSSPIFGVFWWLQHIAVNLTAFSLPLAYVSISLAWKIKYFLRLTDKDSCSALSVIWKMKIYCSQLFVIFNRIIFYPFMSEARQINGFWNLFPMLILFPKFWEQRDRSAVLSPVGKGRGICSCFVLRAASQSVWTHHPFSASACSQPEGPFLLM